MPAFDKKRKALMESESRRHVKLQNWQGTELVTARTGSGNYWPKTEATTS